MAQPSFEFALGRISVLSTHLLSASQLRRIAEAGSTKEAQKLLLETGYGENAATEQELATGEIDLIIRGQLQLTRKRIKELTPDPELTGLFLLPVDTHNIKALLKARLLGTSADEILRDGGNFPLDTPPEQLGARLNQGAHGADLVQAINEFAQTGDLGIIARRMQEGKMQIIRLAKWETDSLGPIVGYLYAREVEAEALRLIFGALAGGFEAELPEIYT